MRKFLLLPVLLIWGCTEIASNRSMIDPNPVGIQEGNFAYSFAEGNCHTGEKSFSTKRAYCVALQSESLNQSCALTERKKRFARDCETFEFKWLESVRCDFFLENPSKILEKKSFCAGRMEIDDFENVSERSGEAIFKNGGYQVEIDLNAGQSYSANIEVRDSSGFRIEEFAIQSEYSEQREATLTNTLRMRIACYRTNGCPKTY